ncbi:MAG TPA: serine/threonine protein kinase [Elusimicrobia bacterium]|nr:serine/threonine protein kinase [Elusimicrobiota bacterium]
MRKFIFSDILWGLALTLAALFFYFTGTGLETAELKFYDFRSRLSAEAPAKSDIAVIEINDDSISKIGRWPWSRSKIADMLVWLSSAPARPSVIGLNILFSEPEKNSDAALAETLKAKYTELVAAKKIKETGKESEFLLAIETAKKAMDNDAKLAEACAAAGNVVLPLYFATGTPVSKPKPEPDWLKRLAPSVSHNAGPAEMSVEATEMSLPLDILASSAAGAGHVNVFSDIDGAVRKEYPYIPYGQNFYPSFAAELVRVSLGLTPDKVVVSPGSSAAFGKSLMPLGPDSSALLAFNKSKTFKYYSFYDVMNDKIVPEAFKDKIVLIGLTAQGVGSLYVTPTDSAMSTVDFTATVVGNILSGRFISRPEWAYPAELGLIIIAGLFTAFLLPRLKAGTGAVLAGGMFAALVTAGMFLFTSKGLWLKIMYPAVVLVAGYIFVITKRFFSTEKKKELIEVSQIETNKMLGLSFQGQGMLDLAFEKFRLCPLDVNMKDTLYNLALDFERKRQYNKAVAVYEHISGRDPEFKDIKTKIDMLKKAADGAVFGNVGGKNGGGDATMMVAGSSATPMLGRYEIKKELGKGAMGIVYLGVDPKINRQVAIKTMRFEEGLEEKAMKDLKDRFFREAQAAGNLTHPNIVKIFDAGEEQDIAYIAMELLKGDDLKKWSTKDNLLPTEKALEYIARAAEALDYAHKNGVVHRDIKPANIMLLDDGTIRVADFGIARITEHSKTATGTVLGTPYYMSPEQIAGKKVDGRADLFSLGVTLYEMLTGERPWKGGESIGTLLFQITSDPYPDPMTIKPDLPPGILAVIDKALKKNPEERFQTGGEMAEAIRAVMAGKTPEIRSTPTPQAAPAPQPKPAEAAAKPAAIKSEPAQRPPVAAPVNPAPAAPQAPAAQQKQAPAASAPAAQIQPKPFSPAPAPAAAPMAAPQPKPPAPAQPAAAPAGIELAPRAGLEMTLNVAPKPEIKPAAAPQPAPAAPVPAPAPAPVRPQAPSPAPSVSGRDFEKTLPLIYPEEDKK